MELLFLIFISIIFLFIFHGINHYRRSRRLPLGPIGFPIIGNLLELGPKPHESLAKLAQKHGPLMTIQMGSITSVVASTPDAAREILQRKDEACSGRPMPDVANALKNPEAAIIWMTTDETWQAMRKALNMYPTNQQKLNALSDLRQNVVDGTLDLLRESGRKKVDVDIGKLAFAVSLNQMSNTILSQNATSYESDTIMGFKMAIETVMEVIGKFNIADVFPVLKPLDPQNIRREAKTAFNYLDEVIEGFASERLIHRESKLPVFGDMLDSMLDYSLENEANFKLLHIKCLILALFIGGADTTHTVTWTMTELLLNPNMLLKLREEVDQIVGKDGKIEEAKILDLPYLQAVINESMRLHFTGPLLLPHKTEREVKLNNYTVPANTQILVNAWAIARDQSYWDSPSSYMPERFLTRNHNIDYKGQHFEFIPFGSGRRMCPGMLAKRVVSLMVASFVYHFDWKLPHAKDEMDMNEMFGVSLQKATPLVATPIPLK